MDGRWYSVVGEDERREIMREESDSERTLLSPLAPCLVNLFKIRFVYLFFIKNKIIRF